jgi:hypothetical protein
LQSEVHFVEMFEYVAVLTSIVVGLGMTHLLQGTARLIQHPERGRPYWIHLGWVLYMFLMSIFWWWWEFRLGSLEAWTFQVYAFVILFAVTVYLLCALLFPSDLEGYDGFKGYFYSRRAWFFGTFVLYQLVDFGDTMLKGDDYLAGLGAEYLVGKVFKVSLSFIAIRTGNEWFHGSFMVAILVYQLSWALRLYETVG